MENNKRKIITIIITILVSVGITLLITSLISQTKSKKDQNFLKEARVISTEKMSNYNLSDFSIVFTGTQNLSFTNKDVSKMDIYKIKAIVNDIDNNKKYNEYIGIKFKDILKSKNINAFTKITAYTDDGISIEYDFANIDDNSYIIFERNNHNLSHNSKVGLINLNFNSKYYIDGLTKINFE